MQKKYLPLILFGVAVIVGVLGYVIHDGYLQHVFNKGRFAQLDGGFYQQNALVPYQDAYYAIPPDELYDTGVAAENIPALNDPTFVSIAAADEYIADDLPGIDVAVNGQHRFYPVQIMNWHEIVNDTFADKKLLVYYSPLSGGAAVYERDFFGGFDAIDGLPVIAGETPVFHASGKVYNNDMLLTEEKTDTVWSGLDNRVVVGKLYGDFRMALKPYPFVFMKWSDWKEQYPSGTVLSRDTGVVRDYTRHPYGNYDTSPGVFFPMNHTESRLAAKETVYVVESGNNRVAFADKYLVFQEIPNQKLGDLPIVALVSVKSQLKGYALRVFERTVNGQILTFTRKDGDIIDNETGSVWNEKGEAISGELRGTQLKQVPHVRMFAFTAFALYPNIPISGEEILQPKTEDDSATTDDVTSDAMDLTNSEDKPVVIE